MEEDWRMFKDDTAGKYTMAISGFLITLNFGPALRGKETTLIVLKVIHKTWSVLVDPAEALYMCWK